MTALRRLSRRVVARDVGLAEEIAGAVLQRGGRGALWRAARLPRGLVTRALQGLPPDKRSRAIASIAEARKTVRQFMGPSTGPLVFAESALHALHRLAQGRPALTPVVQILERQAVRNELANLRYDAACALQFESRRRKREPAKSKLDPFSQAGAAAIYAHRDAIQTDPEARVRHNRWSELCNLVVPTKPQVTDPELLRAVSRPVALAVLKLSPDQFDRLTKAGVLRKAPRYGMHDLIGLVEDRLKLAEDENGADAGDITIAEAKRRFWAAKALSEELSAAKTAGDLVPIVAVEELERECLATLAPRLAAELAGLSDAAVVRRRLLTELRRVRASVARSLAGREGHAALAGAVGGDADAATGAIDP